MTIPTRKLILLSVLLTACSNIGDLSIPGLTTTLDSDSEVSTSDESTLSLDLTSETESSLPRSSASSLSSSESSSQALTSEPSSSTYIPLPTSEDPFSSNEPLPIGTLHLDSVNGGINGAYAANENTVTASTDEGDQITLGYVYCMTSSNNTYNFAQLRKNQGMIYNKTPLYIRSFEASFIANGSLKLELANKADFSDAITPQASLESNKYYGFAGNFGFFRVSAIGGAAYIGTITITYGEQEPFVSTSEETSVSSSISSSSSNSSSSSSSSSSTSRPDTSVDVSEYYDGISSTSTGAALKTALHNLIKGHTNIGYSALYSAYPDTDTDDEGKIIDIYSSYRYDPYTDHQGASGKGNYSAEGQMYNREHLVPDSVITGDAASDLHQLLPTDAYVNNRRSNYPHAMVNTTVYTSSNGTKVGSCATSGYTGNVCEPIDEYKGDVARIYFYVITRYENSLTSWKTYGSFDKQTFPGLSTWAKNLYLQWHNQDPVSEKEIKRNNGAYSYQHNRNPFVDHPEYANRIWG